MRRSGVISLVLIGFLWGTSPQDAAFAGISPTNTPPQPQQLPPVQPLKLAPAPGALPSPPPAGTPPVLPNPTTPTPAPVSAKPTTPAKPVGKPVASAPVPPPVGIPPKKLTPLTPPKGVPGPIPASGKKVNYQLPVSKSYFSKVEIKPSKNAQFLSEIDFIYKGVNGGKIVQKVPINKLIDPTQPIAVTHAPAHKEKVKVYKVGPLFQLYLAKDKLFFQTKDQLVKDFSLHSPDRLVLDFKTSAVPKFNTIVQPLSSPVASKMVIGYHGGGMYRVVFYLTKPYKYRITKFEDGIKVDFIQ
ncbi:MAG: AMIN domain-containing protein [Campylobacterales bacterium]